SRLKPLACTIHQRCQRRPSKTLKNICGRTRWVSLESALKKTSTIDRTRLYNSQRNSSNPNPKCATRRSATRSRDVFLAEENSRASLHRELARTLAAADPQHNCPHQPPSFRLYD